MLPGCVKSSLSLTCNCEPQGVTPLHLAAQLGHEGVAALLLEHGASLMFDATSACKVRGVLAC